ncbi:MAG: sigma factor-like helix-turn-helix DNA-binding protein [Patescibacteria group bacterium]
MISGIVDSLVSGLKPRHREIISGRFGLGNAKRQTLADLGEKYLITRERVRQIEAEALETLKRKFEEENEGQKRVLESVKRHLENMGGVRREDLFLREIKVIVNDPKLHYWHLRLISEIVGHPLYYVSDEHFHHFWYLNEKDVEILRRFVDNLERLIADKKEHLVNNNKFSVYLASAARRHRISDIAASNYASVSKKFSVNPFGDFGLSEWEEVNPKTMRAKAYLILKKQNQPMHFKDISEAINKYNFDDRSALPQTVHNELIKDPKIVLVGRGIYALKEQGYSAGIARDVIRKILKDKGPMNFKNLLAEVLKQRLLKQNTILLNLQNKKHFKKLADGRYSFVK